MDRQKRDSSSIDNKELAALSTIFGTGETVFGTCRGVWLAIETNLVPLQVDRRWVSLGVDGQKQDTTRR